MVWIGAPPLDNAGLRALRDACRDIGWVMIEAGDSCHQLEIADTSQVTNMGGMFNGASSFNSDLSKWNTIQVTNMGGMFIDASSFDCDVSAWDTSKVTNMGRMFDRASSFNCDLSSWQTGQVTDMNYMLFYAKSFTSDLSSWDTSHAMPPPLWPPPPPPQPTAPTLLHLTVLTPPSHRHIYHSPSCRSACSRASTAPTSATPR